MQFNREEALCQADLNVIFQATQEVDQIASEIQSEINKAERQKIVKFEDSYFNNMRHRLRSLEVPSSNLVNALMGLCGGYFVGTDEIAHMCRIVGLKIDTILAVAVVCKKIEDHVEKFGIQE